jgi:hypothetical protein
MTAKIITIPTLVLVALIAACSSSGAADQAPVPTQAALTPTPLQTPTSTEVTAEPAGGECSPLMIDGKLRILADSWSLVVAAKGESDEEDMLKEFQDGASDMVEDFEDADGCKGSKESTAAAELNYQTSILAAQILVEQPEDRVYDDVAAGNALLDETGVDGAQFIEAACHGSVEETADCTALS